MSPRLERRLRQHRPRLALERVDAHELLERVDGLDRSAFLEEIVVQRLESLPGFLFVAHLLEGAGGREPGVEVGRVDRAETNDNLRCAAAIALRATPRGDRVQM